MRATVLLVEDEALIRELLSSLLTENGYNVIWAANGTDAIENCRRKRPDIVLLNHRLPESQGGRPEGIGLMLLRIIKGEWPRMQVVMLTGTDTLNVVFEAGRCGAAAYLTKPFEVERLLEILKNLLEDQEGPIEVERVNLSKIEPPKQDDSALSPLERMERKMIVEMLKETAGNKFKAAKRLGIGRQTLYNKIKEYGVDVL